ncbi:MAG: SpaA isopeptide-forming pilin-related protein [Clostridium sp.]|nr:SpaA isopeptide-forming pilin-related protein [Clostridium sp.]
MKLFSKNKWIALTLVLILVFSIMPLNYDIAGERGFSVEDRTEQSAEEQDVEEETSGTATDETETSETETSRIEISGEEPEAVNGDAPAWMPAADQQVEDEQNAGGQTTETDSLLPAGEENSDDDLPEEDFANQAEQAAIALQDDAAEVGLADETADLLDNTTIRLDKLTLEASYRDEDGKKQVVNMTTTETTVLPGDAEIDMNFNFVMGNGSAVDCSKEYVYRIPDGIRVDVNNTHELTDANNKSIGRVVISQDGTLTFTFYEDAIKGQPNVPFYVRFAGGFSSDLQEDLGEHELSFPTASGQFTYKVDITESNKDDDDDEPGELKTYKSGTKVERNGQPYIEWTVEVDLNGRDSLTADVVDVLPAGLTYVPGSVKLAGEGYGSSGTVSEAVQGSTVTFHVQNSKPDWRTKLTFLTGYDESIFPDKITGSGVTVNNTAAVNPENETQTSVQGSGTAHIVPAVLEKSGTLDVSDSTITWTVTINRDKLDIGGTVYTDTFGEGLSLAPGTSVSIANGQGTISNTADGFTFTAPAAPYRKTVTLTYKTAVADIAQENFKNSGKLTGDKYDVPVEATVRGMDLLQKAGVSYNEITKQFTWTITVNEAGIELMDAKISDVFEEKEMSFVSATGADGTSYDMENGTAINLGTITEKKVITVVTQLNETDTPWTDNGWYTVKNTAKLEWGEDNHVSSDAYKGFQYKKPDLMDKDGKITENGTVQWTLLVKEPQLKQESIRIEDQLPTDMEYVEGTFQLMYYTYAWDSSQMMKVEPDYNAGTNTLSYEFGRDTLADAYYIDHSFVIQYETRLKDLNNKGDSGKYTNEAFIEVDYDGDVKVTDTASKTVEGVVGGTLEKEYAYQGGKDYVDWTVKINEAGYDMSSVKNPVIKDKLEDYFDYVSGTLYKVVNGQRQEVPAADYAVVVINNHITVKLPEIGKDTYEFVFRTQFNISDNRLESMTIKNTVDFTGDGYSDSATSDEVKNVSFSSSSAGSVLEKELRIRKVDAQTGEALAGAEFEIFYQGVSAGTAVTDENGFAVFSGISSTDEGITYTLHETEAPNGYVKQETDEQIVIKDAELKADDSGVRYIEHVIENQPIKQQTQINVYKSDGKGRILPGAEFGLYNDVDCTDLVAARVTDKAGIATFAVEYGGTAAVTYYIKEINPPPGYVREETPTVYPVTVNTDGTVTYGQAQVITVGELKAISVVNTKGQAKLVLHKVKEGEETAKIAGAEFTIYQDAACTDVVGRETTDANGELTFADLELGKTYYYRETSAPDGYAIESAIHSVTIGEGTENENLTEEVTVENKASLGYIEITKTDDAIPAVPIAGVEFTLYQEDGVTPYEKNGVTYVVTTDSTGKAVFTDLPYGSYVVKETETKAGYVAKTDGTAVVVNSVEGSKINVINERIKFNVKVKKTDDSEKPLEGVTFVLYTKDGKRVKDGKTDKNGELVFADIVYGDYYVKETAGIKGYIVSDEVFEIDKTQIQNKNQTVEKTFVNKKESATITFKKRDAKNTANYLKGAEFTIYDSNGLKVAEAVSDDNGIVTFSNLIYDTYTIRETKAPEDYKLDNTVWTVEVTGNGPYEELYRLLSPNEAVGEIDNEELEKGDEYLAFHLKKVDGSNGQLPLKGAEFTLSKQEQGSDVWETMATAYSDENGIVQFHNIAIREDDETVNYKIEETAAPTGYRLDPENCSKVYTYKELTQTQIDSWDRVGYQEWKTDFSNVPVIDTYENQQILGAIRVLKTGLLSQNRLAGAEFTLYERDGVTVYKKADGTAYQAVTDDNGIAMFENLPIGYYVVKETGAPDGYLLNSLYAPSVQILDDTVADVHFVDTSITVLVSKLAVNGITELEGAELAVYDSHENLIDTWITTDTAHRLPVAKLKVGEIYTLTERKAPDGYRFADPVKFRINSDGSLVYLEGDGAVSENYVVMRDQPLALAVRKVDEQGNGLTGALLEMIDDADGTVVYSFTSDGTTKDIPYHLLRVPEQENAYTYYTIHEKSAPLEYELAEDIQIAIGKDGTIYQVNGTEMTVAANPIVMTDKIKSDLYFNKVDASGNTRVSGAGLEVTAQDGTVVAQWTSGTAPKKIALSDGTYILKETSAPDGYTCAQEVTFTVEGGKITDISGEAGSLSYDRMTLTLRNTTISVRVRKLTEDFVVLPGASFELYESDPNGTKGRMLESFQSTEASTVLNYRNLKLNGWYLLVETEAPSGYEMVEPLLFYLDENGIARDQYGEEFENNLIEVMDNEKQLGVQKIDAATGEDLSGVALSITSQEDEDFEAVAWVTDGTVKYFKYSQFKRDVTYTLSEGVTINGYTYADAVDFMISSEDECVYSGGEQVEKNRILLKNKSFEVIIRKLSLKTNSDLPGATLAVKDAQGNIVEQWVSDGSPHKLDVTKLHVSQDNEYVYTLSEIQAPELYAQAQPIDFVIDQTGVVKRLDNEAVSDNTITMYDEYRGITFSKTDVGGKEVPGARLTITSTQDTDFVPLTWESTDTPKNWNMDLFKRNTDYILTEEAAPNGYAYAESIVFRIDDNGVVYVNGVAVTDQTVTMIDDVLQVTVAKKEKGTKEFLPGASLSIVDTTTDTVVYTWKTKDGAVEIPTDKLTASKEGEQIIYALRENRAPEGYKLAKDILFYLDAKGSVHTIDEDGGEKQVAENTITMYDAKEKTPKDTDGKKTTGGKARTGDYMPFILVISVLFISVGILLVLSYWKKKRR